MINISSFKRRVILLALQGKLTNQYPESESVGELIPLLKKSVNMQTVFSEQPTTFDIPSNWKWCMLCEAVSLDDGVECSNLKMPYLDVKYLRERKDPTIIDHGYMVKTGEKAILVDGENSGEVFSITENGYRGSTLKLLSISPAFLSEYVLFFIMAHKERFKENKTGSAIPHLNKALFFELPIPLPPLEEQKRIVKIINSIFYNLDIIQVKQEEVSKIQKNLKNRVIDLAIRGKLVEQSDGEDAGALIEKIAIEKKRLTERGTIKKTKPLPCVKEEDFPFSIPPTWRWARLGDICSKIVDGDHNPPAGIQEKTGYLMISAININNDSVCALNRVRYLDFETFQKENERTKLQIGDILFTIVGSMGRSCIYDGTLKLSFQRSVSVITTLIDNQYLKRVLDSLYIQKFMEFNSTGTAQKGFYLKQVAALLIPVPPLEEQKRIVKRIDDILSVCQIIC